MDMGQGRRERKKGGTSGMKKGGSWAGCEKVKRSEEEISGVAARLQPLWDSVRIPSHDPIWDGVPHCTPGALGGTHTDHNTYMCRETNLCVGMATIACARQHTWMMHAHILRPCLMRPVCVYVRVSALLLSRSNILCKCCQTSIITVDMTSSRA